MFGVPSRRRLCRSVRSGGLGLSRELRVVGVFVFSGKLPVRDRVGVRSCWAWLAGRLHCSGKLPVWRWAVWSLSGDSVTACHDVVPCSYSLRSMRGLLVHGYHPLLGVVVVCRPVSVVVFPLGGVRAYCWFSRYGVPWWGGMCRLGRE